MLFILKLVKELNLRKKEEKLSHKKNLKRVLTYFSKKTELIEGEIPLTGIALSELQVLYNINQASEDYAMYACYPVRKKQAIFFEQHLKRKLDLSKFDYFVECYED